jgi:hypothetical protein
MRSAVLPLSQSDRTALPSALSFALATRKRGANVRCRYCGRTSLVDDFRCGSLSRPGASFDFMPSD